jgi:hypothetical protein
MAHITLDRGPVDLTVEDVTSGTASSAGSKSRKGALLSPICSAWEQWPFALVTASVGRYSPRTEIGLVRRHASGGSLALYLITLPAYSMFRLLSLSETGRNCY